MPTVDVEAVFTARIHRGYIAHHVPANDRVDLADYGSVRLPLVTAHDPTAWQRMRELTAAPAA